VEQLGTQRAMRNILRRGLEISTVIDIGASNGSWSKELMPLIPHADYVLIEAQRSHENALVEFCKAYQNAQYILAAAGNDNGVCYFDDADPFGGLASLEKGFADCYTKLPMIAVDSVISGRNLKAPFLLKLDTHGFEIPILEGAKHCLQNTHLVVIEAYIFRLNARALLFHELCTYMYGRGFQCIDMSEPIWREKDNALWQWDLFFQPKKFPIFQDISYV